ncbi:alpha/beta hydrolase [Streptomyces sp. H27-C3]|uniref:alpha/beta hydrolase n=1 Tax=Streptomyces sp. H27-C3 TaxID=3046305 RepID=UPI0024BA33DC|nr:alpha/beta hydrolase [Streptomyces sp. H27-C3]MDJ0466259.1 alpha/beta hydrolase [Streptomyces sp. H27-C3]
MHPVSLPAGDLTLSALLAVPDGPPRGTIVAVHGGGTSAAYFDGQAHPDVSLLTLGARLGYTVVAVDRPGYGASAAQLPGGQTLTEQATALRMALRHLGDHCGTGTGMFMLAHSFGGKLALAYAAGADERDSSLPALLGLDISGLGHTYLDDPSQFLGANRHSGWKRNWGALRYYPPNTFREADTMVGPMPVHERTEAGRWPLRFAELAGRVRVPVRLTFAECELWWRNDEESLTDLAAGFTAAPLVRVDRQPGAGHNISLGWAARAYHLRAVAFFEECLGRQAAGASAAS